MSTTHHLPVWKIAAAAAALALAPAVLASPAAAATDTQSPGAYHAAHHARAHVARTHIRHSYARYAPRPVEDEWDGYAHQPYHCGLGLYNTPLPCEPGD